MSRLSLIPLGLVFGLVALELVLQVGALYVAATGQDFAGSWTSRPARRVLCLGDSNTYGVYLLDRRRAYPQQFQTLWNETVSSPRVEVLNLGYPGTNSSALRNNFSKMLDTLTPDVVIIMVGANDYWTMPVPLDDSSGLLELLVRSAKRSSRVVQLFHMLGRSLDDAQLEVSPPVGDGDGQTGRAQLGDLDFEFAWQRADTRHAYEEALQTNLQALIRKAASAGAELILMTYPSRMWNYGDASTYTRKVAEATNTRLVDLAPVFAEVCPQEPCPQFLLKDHHPNAKGYRLIAETLMRELRDVL
jgi:lysophospholipase L1-like esterase